MRAPRTLAVAALALLPAFGLAGPRPTLAHPAHDVPASGYIFAGIASGHIYRSADGGATWEEADSGLAANGKIIESLAVAPDGTTVYAGTDGSGLWASPDDGTSWQPADGSGDGAIPADALVPGVAVDPQDGQHLYAVSADDTFHESKDGGQSWTAQSLPQSDELTMVLDPQRPATLLVGTAGNSTGHTLAAPFLAYWQAHEGGTLMGPPISEPLREQNGDGTGRSYLVQYFRNMRLEYHPELARTPYTVSPGLIGRQLLHQRGWI